MDLEKMRAWLNRWIRMPRIDFFMGGGGNNGFKQCHKGMQKVRLESKYGKTTNFESQG